MPYTSDPASGEMARSATTSPARPSSPRARYASAVSPRAVPSSGTRIRPYGPRPGAAGSSAARTRSTGSVVCRRTSSATEPSSARPAPVRPCVLITMISAPLVLAAWAIAWSAVSWSATVETAKPSPASRCRSTERYASASRTVTRNGEVGAPAMGTWGAARTNTRPAPVVLARRQACGRACSASGEPSSGTRMVLIMVDPPLCWGRNYHASSPFHLPPYASPAALAIAIRHRHGGPDVTCGAGRSPTSVPAT